jgi:hypothetical protein
MWCSSCERIHLRARVGASSPPGTRIEIDRSESGSWDDDAVMWRLASETVAAATEWSEGHTLRPKRVADDLSSV